MLAIQIIINLVIIFLIINLVLKIKRNRINLSSFLFWLILWLSGATIINWPESTSFFARILGVGRGADVIIYFSIILIFYFIFYFTLKLRKLEREITQLVRKISFQESKSDKDSL